jgi:hypothetical protein
VSAYSAGASVFDDLDAIRLPADSSADVEEILARVPVRKPSRKWFVRVHPTECMRIALIEDDDTREQYLVTAAIRGELADYCKHFTVHLAMNRHGHTFLWPVPSPDEGRINEWHTTHRTAAETARTRWLQMVPDMLMGSYRLKVATAAWPEPEWREESFKEILEIAFRGRVINDRSHPVAKQLLGLA